MFYYQLNHQGIIHLVKKLPQEAVPYKLQEITTRPLRNVDNVKGGMCKGARWE